MIDTTKARIEAEAKANETYKLAQFEVQELESMARESDKKVGVGVHSSFTIFLLSISESILHMGNERSCELKIEEFENDTGRSLPKM